MLNPSSAIWSSRFEARDGELALRQKLQVGEFAQAAAGRGPGEHEGRRNSGEKSLHVVVYCTPTCMGRSSYITSSLYATKARRRLGGTRPKIAVPVMLGAMPNQHAASRFDSLDERGSLHATAMSATLRIPGSSSLVKSL